MSLPRLLAIRSTKTHLNARCKQGLKEVNKEPWSYTVQCNGRTFSRNRCHILPVAEPPPSWLNPVNIGSQNTTTHTEDFDLSISHTTNSPSTTRIHTKLHSSPPLRSVTQLTEHGQVASVSRKYMV